MQQQLQQLQYQYRIYNSDVEPEHEIEGYCACPIHQYQQRKRNRLGVQETWCRAVMYPGQQPVEFLKGYWIYTNCVIFDHRREILQRQSIRARSI